MTTNSNTVEILKTLDSHAFSRARSEIYCLQKNFDYYSYPANKKMRLVFEYYGISVDSYLKYVEHCQKLKDVQTCVAQASAIQLVRDEVLIDNFAKMVEENRRLLDDMVVTYLVHTAATESIELPCNAFDF